MQVLAKIFIAGVILFSTCFVEREVDVKEGGLEVVGVSDGDTVTVFNRDENKRQKIRLATIDAPEYKQPFGIKSKKSLSDLVYKKEVTIRSFGRDRYGRITAEIFLDGKNINVEQIKRGFAWHYKKHQKQQSRANQIIYSEAENSARENRVGLWRDKNPIAPWKFRNSGNDKRNRTINLN